MNKLKSRKFWIAVCLAGYGAVMGIRSLGMDNAIVTAVCVIGAAAVGIGYVFAEALADAEGAANAEHLAVIEDEESEG